MKFRKTNKYNIINFKEKLFLRISKDIHEIVLLKLLKKKFQHWTAQQPFDLQTTGKVMSYYQYIKKNKKK